MLYATDGSLEQILLKYPLLKDEEGKNVWDIVVIDEVHERNERIDYIIMKMKIALKLNPTLKLILMSATVDPKPFEKYFEEFHFGNLLVEGTTPKDVTDIWIKSSNPYNKEGIIQIKNILDNEIDENDDEDITEEEYKKMKMIKGLYDELEKEDIKEVRRIKKAVDIAKEQKEKDE